MCAGALGEKASVLCLVISFDIFHLLVITLRHNDVIIKKIVALRLNTKAQKQNGKETAEFPNNTCIGLCLA